MNMYTAQGGKSETSSTSKFFEVRLKYSEVQVKYSEVQVKYSEVRVKYD